MFLKHQNSKEYGKDQLQRGIKETPTVNLHQKLITCYNCGLLGNMIKDYPNIKKKNERTRFKSKKVGKRAMVTT